MKNIIKYLALMLFLVACGTTQNSDNGKQKVPDIIDMKLYSADTIETQDLNISSNYLWLKNNTLDGEAEHFDIFRVESDDINKIKIYAHVLDVNLNMIGNIFNKHGYKICGFEDNGRIITEYDVAEFQRKDISDYKIAFVLDHSGSIGESRAREIQQSFLNVVDLKENDDEFSVVKFDHRVRTEMGLEKDNNTIKSKFPIIGLNAYGGATSLYNGIWEGMNTIKSSNDRKIVVAVSDGYDNYSTIKLNQMIKEALDNNVSIFTVGFGNYIDVQKMEYIAQRTGGKFYHIYKTDEFNDVFKDIYKRINSYYMFTYKAINYGKHTVTITLCKDSKKYTDTAVFYNDDQTDCDIAMSLETRGIRPDRTEVYDPEVTIWERARREYHPLLPYIFFDENSSALPTRYNRRNSNDITNNESHEYITNNSKLDIYYDILNIIGERWHKNKTAKITLTGCNDGKGENISISKERAETIQKYLVNVCMIPNNFIQVKERNLPSFPSKGSDKKVLEENRRVEIESDDDFILSPFIYGERSFEASPPLLRTYVNIVQEKEVNSWKVEFTKESKLLWEQQTHTSSPVKYIDYLLNAKVTYDKALGQYLITGADNLQVQLIAYKDEAKTIACSTAKKDIKIVQDTIEEIMRQCLEARQIESLNLILFNMNRSTFDDSILEKYLKDILKTKYDKPIYIDIFGHTDVIGSYESNLSLSNSRAGNTESVIKKLIKQNNWDAYIRNTTGFGEDIMPMILDNDLPEARMYSRTVNVLIYLPISCIKK